MAQGKGFLNTLADNLLNPQTTDPLNIPPVPHSIEDDTLLKVGLTVGAAVLLSKGLDLLFKLK